ncbi:uncharacterized protein EI90DRAFT_3013660 [Cantharellus anzutake]|uniref:uncharacterized protein n=1 Tax=Cantharellus anzutake TaxID=1750568 RepID=UPI001903070C|nr:uncharacterized protein EI90DRAFT_3013660 [Cantharellus anzutake]KAF8337440.1 hypothetical protein EI90DRAFT_3013660 [Cantharellus anzutake]
MPACLPKSAIFRLSVARFSNGLKKDLVTSFPSAFPWDVLCCIIACADPETRRKLALLNRDCNFETNKYGWRRLRIVNGKGRIDQAIRQAAETISRDTARAKNVRSLEIDLKGKPSPFRRANMEKTFRKLCQALQSLTSLRILHIRLEHYNEELATLMSEYKFDFELAFLATTIYIPDGLHDFIASHPEIRSFAQIPKAQHSFLRGNIPRSAVDISADLLPNLSEVWTNSDVIPTTVANRPIVSIGTHIYSNESTDNFLRAIRLSTMGINHITLCVKVDQSESFYQRLFYGLVHIETLHSIHIDLWGPATSDASLLPAILRPLSLFPSLQKLEFGGNRTLDVLSDPAPFSCKTLRIMDVYDYATRGGRHFERTSTKSPWVGTTASIVSEYTRATDSNSNQAFTLFTYIRPGFYQSYSDLQYYQHRPWPIFSSPKPGLMNAHPASPRESRDHPCYQAQRRFISSKAIETLEEISNLNNTLSSWRTRIHKLKTQRASCPAYSSLSQYATEKKIRVFVHGPDPKVLTRTIKQITKKNWSAWNRDSNGKPIPWKVKQWSSHDETRLAISEEKVTLFEAKLRTACVMRDAWSFALQTISIRC